MIQRLRPFLAPRFHLVSEMLRWTLKRQLEYRLDFFLGLAQSLVLPICIDLALWFTAFSSGASLPYTLNEMVTYIIVANVVLPFTSVGVERRIEDDVKRGRILSKMLWPIQYLEFLTWSTICSKVMSLIILIVIISIVAVLFSLFSISSVSLAPKWEAVLLVFAAMCLQALFSMAIGLSSFYLTEIWGLSSLKSLGMALVTGAVIPIDLLPQIVQDVFVWTPFPYMTFLPVKLMMGSTSGIERFVVMAPWIVSGYLVILGIGVMLLWSRGTRHHAAVGG